VRTAALFLLALALTLGSCQKASGKPAANKPPEHHNLVLVMSGSSQSQWDADLLGALGAELNFNPYEKQSTDGHLDVLGPYDVKLGDSPVTLSICLLGLDKFMGMQAQSDLGVEGTQWIKNQKPDVAWLDGDRVNFFIGRDLVANTPVVFTGVVNDRQTYYAVNATGVYKRPALPALLKLIWDRAPKAKNFALVSDAAPQSRGAVQKFHELLGVALTQQGKVVASEPAKDWKEMRARLSSAAKKADAIIVTGIGEEEGGESFTTPCPGELLDGVKVPVVAVGGSDAATCFPVVVRLRPSAHVKLALGMVGQVFDGANAGGIPTVTPEEMQVTVNE